MANEAVQQGQKLEPPMVTPRSTVDVAKLQRQAEELNQLAAQVQKEVGLLKRGQLSGGLLKHLEQMAKLVHHLRLELSK